MPWHQVTQPLPTSTGSQLISGAAGPLCNRELGDLAHLRLGLGTQGIRHAPPQLDALDLLPRVAGVGHLHGLRDAEFLVRLQGPTCLGLQL